MRRDKPKPRTVGILMLTIFILITWLYNVYDDKRFIESDIELYKIALCNKDTANMILLKKVDSLEKREPEKVFICPEKKFRKPIIDTIKSKIDSVIVPIDTMRSE